MFQKALPALVILLHFALAAASPAAASGPAKRYAEISQALEGLRVSEVRYTRGDSAVSPRYLPRGARLETGELLDKNSIADAVEALYRQNIYSHIDVTAEANGGEVEIVFALTPSLIIREVEFVGVSAYKPREMRRIIGIRGGAPVEIPIILQAVRRLEEAYLEAGYFTPKIDVALRQSADLSAVLVRFFIYEGPRSTISKVRINGDLPSELEPLINSFSRSAAGAVASKRRIDELRRELLAGLRGEGYLQSLVRLEGMRYLEQDRGVEVALSIEVREPLTISFAGNQIFSEKELVALLELETRTAPFGPNAIPNFLRDIRELYQRAGYYDVDLSYEPLPSEGRRKNILITIDEGARRIVQKIEFAGNSAFSKAELAEAVATEETGGLLSVWRSGTLVSEVLEDDVSSLLDLYRSRGFFNAAISAEVLKHGEHGLLVRFLITEGRQTTVSAVFVDWVDAAAPPLRQFAPRLLTITPQLKLHDVLSVSALEEARSSLLSAVFALGFPAARVVPSYETETGEVRFQVTLGKPVRVSRVVVRGNRLTLASVVERELALGAGDPWNPELIRESEYSLYQLGVFQNVQLGPADGTLDQPEEVLAVTVTERDTGEFAFGVNYNTEDGIGLLGELTQRNIYGLAHRFSLRTELYFQNEGEIVDAARGRLSYNIPRFLLREGEFYAEVFAQEAVEFAQNYSYDRLGTSLAYEYQFTPRMSATLGQSVFSEKVFDVPASVVAGPDDTGTTLYSIARLDLVYDARNDIYNPSSGYQTSLAAFVAPEELGSDAFYAGFSAAQSLFFKLNSFIVWANNLRFDYLQPLGSTDVIPLGRRLFLGGRTTLRGYSPNSIGPDAEDGNVAGGDLSLVLNTELQFEVAQNVVLLTFVDAGQAVLKHPGTFEGDTKSLSKLRYSPGVGVRYISPIGPIGVDLGFAVQQERGEEFARIVVNIGGSF